jgi:4-hydroxy-4-methyl-2-oxoglutarate aldolase
MNPPLRPDLLTRLAACDTCCIANAVDATGVRLANLGFSDSRVTCWTPGLPPMVGTVLTLKVRSAQPPMKNAFYLDQPDWWERLEAGPGPRILAIEDVDAEPGRGSSVGPVHACILKALGFVGVLTNGAIRGYHRFGQIGLSAFAGNVSPAHAYSHVVELGTAVEIAGLPLATGDLVHADANGVVMIPAGTAEKVATLAEAFRDRERRVCEFCHSAEFSPEALKHRIGSDASRR